MKKKLFLLLSMCLVLMFVSSAFAASLKHLGDHPFSAQCSSATEFRTMVEKNSADLKTGFTKAGYPELFPEFMAQLPAAEIEPTRVAPGEHLLWMVFRNKNTRQVKVVKDVTWDGEKPFDAFSFHIDSSGKRYEFIVPTICGNLSLKEVGMVPEKVVAMPEQPKAVPPPPPKPEPMPVEKRKGGPVLDVGLAQQFDPASYVFGRIGYEYPLAEKLNILGLVGGFLRFDGDDGGDAFTADVLLNYYFTEKFFVGGGAGYWSDDSKLDLIIDLGYLIYEKPESFNLSLFLEGRCYSDDLISSEATRLGAGVRFHF